MSKTQVHKPLIKLLAEASQRERETLVKSLEAQGFPGVAAAQVRLLELLLAGPQHIQALAQASGTTKQFCAREVKKLHAQQLVLLAASRQDQRVTLVSLAARGRRLLEVVAREKRARDAAMEKVLGKAGAVSLRRLLGLLVDAP